MHGCRTSGFGGDQAHPAAHRWTVWTAAVGGLLGTVGTGPAAAENWTYSASAGATAAYTHNIGESQQNDGVVTSLSAALNIRGEGARVKLNGTVGATQVFYLGQSQNNSLAPNVGLSGSVEAVENFFWVDATANASTTFATPFGPQPANLTTATNNRYISEGYSVSPHIQGLIGSNTTYSVRDDNFWSRSTTFGNSSVSTPTTYWNNFNAQTNSTFGPRGLTLEYSRQSYDNGVDTGEYVIQVARAIGSYAVDPQLQVSLRVGYESTSFPALTSNNGSLFPGSSTDGVIYGAGVNWRPTERTSLNGYWEHQFFGSSYNWALTHRLPNVALSANFTRGLTSYPQLALAIPAGVTVAQFLDAAFTTRIPDPAQRAAAVAQFLAQTGLPPTLSSPLNFYAQSITLQQTANLSAVWVGGRNAVGFTVFTSQSEAISGTGEALPPAFQGGANNTQTGASVSYSHPLGSRSSFVASASYITTKPNNTGATATLNNLRSNNFNASLGVSTQFTPKTNGSVGVTYFTFDTPSSSTLGNQSTVSVYASISHTF